MAMRLELPESTQDQLQEIMQREEIKTKSKTITHVLDNYLYRTSEIDRLKMQNHKLSQQLSSLVTNLEQKKQVDQNLQEAVKRVKAYEQGKTETYTMEEFKLKMDDHINEVRA